MARASSFYDRCHASHSGGVDGPGKPRDEARGPRARFVGAAESHHRADGDDLRLLREGRLREHAVFAFDQRERRRGIVHQEPLRAHDQRQGVASGRGARGAA